MSRYLHELAEVGISRGTLARILQVVQDGLALEAIRLVENFLS
jgi:hypothetical protein